MNLLKKLPASSLLIWHELAVVVLVCGLASPTAFSLFLGSLMSLAGVLIRIAAAGFERQVTQFTVHGPYRFVRHPDLLGTFLVLLGLCIASRSGIASIAVLLSTLFIFRAIFVEEEAAATKFGGAQFKDYQLQVSSFLPNLWPYQAVGERGHFSWQRAFMGGRRRELDTMIAIVLGYGVLYAFMTTGSSGLWQGLIAALVAAVFIVHFFYGRRGRNEPSST